MSTIRQSLIWAFAEKYAALILNVVSTIVLARLLSPEEIGIFSVAVVFVGLLQIIREFGVGQYLIQQKELTQDKIRSAFGLTILLAWSSGVLLWVLSSGIADFYNTPELEQVIRVLAINLILIPFGSIVLALLNRELKFDSLFKIKVCGALTYTFTAITLAILDYGYMSLAWASFCNVLVTVFVANLYRPKYSPLLPSFENIRGVFSIGFQLTLASLFKESGTAAPDLVIGKVLSMEAVGYFSRAMGVINLFRQAVMDGINQILLPHFSRNLRDGKSLEELYLKALSYILCIAWPFFVFVAILAEPLVNILFGDQWDNSIPLVQILCLYALLETISAMYNQVLIALGAVAKNMRYEFVINIILIALVIIGVSHGTEGVAWALVVKAFISMVVVYIDVRRLFKTSAKNYFKIFFTNFLIAIFTSIAPVASLYLFNYSHGEHVSGLFFSILLAGACWLTAVIITKHPIYIEIENSFMCVCRLVSNVINK